jgi:endonuclease YncB( thermonuclease family)
MATRILPALLLLALVAAPAAHARGGACTPAPDSPRCHFWHGKVVFVADGDTIDVRIRGAGVRRVRMTGVNAMEMTRYSHTRAKRRGHCHAVAATNRLESLLRRGHNRVRLAAQHPSSRSGRRLRRQVSVRIGGRWVDTGRVLMSEGHTLFLSNPREWAWNRRYLELAREAAFRGIRLWNPRGCGVGAARDAVLDMQLNYDADGGDLDNVNGEWARIFNRSSFPVSLRRWTFRDSAALTYRFPRRARVPAHGSVLLRMGRGRNGGGTFHWGLRTPPFQNPDNHPRRAVGDGGYLFDPRGNLRAWVMYP